MKRFTATEKWGKEWYQQLKPRLKCLWQFICDHADACGVWEPNFGLASFQIGEKVSAADLANFGDRLHKLPTGKYLIPSFIEFQYGKLSEACPAHKPVFRAMERNRVTDTLLNSLCSGLPHRPQEEEKEKEGGSAEGGDSAPPPPKERKDRATKAELAAYCREQGLPASDGEWLFDKWEGNGWKNGRERIRDWRATVRSWKVAGYMASQKGNGNGGKPEPAYKLV